MKKHLIEQLKRSATHHNSDLTQDIVRDTWMLEYRGRGIVVIREVAQHERWHSRVLTGRGFEVMVEGWHLQVRRPRDGARARNRSFTTVRHAIAAAVALIDSQEAK